MITTDIVLNSLCWIVYHLAIDFNDFDKDIQHIIAFQILRHIDLDHVIGKKLCRKWKNTDIYTSLQHIMIENKIDVTKSLELVLKCM